MVFNAVVDPLTLVKINVKTLIGGRIAGRINIILRASHMRELALKGAHTGGKWLDWRGLLSGSRQRRVLDLDDLLDRLLNGRIHILDSLVNQVKCAVLRRFVELCVDRFDIGRDCLSAAIEVLPLKPGVGNRALCRCVRVAD